MQILLGLLWLGWLLLGQLGLGLDTRNLLVGCSLLIRYLRLLVQDLMNRRLQLWLLLHMLLK